jgi:hypothetical protein
MRWLAIAVTFGVLLSVGCKGEAEKPKDEKAAKTKPPKAKPEKPKPGEFAKNSCLAQMELYSTKNCSRSPQRTECTSLMADAKAGGCKRSPCNDLLVIHRKLNCKKAGEGSRDMKLLTKCIAILSVAKHNLCY